MTAKTESKGNIPARKGFVTDIPGILKAEEISILQKSLSQFEQSNSVEIAVVIVDSIKPYKSIEELAYELGEKWEVGKKNYNKGIVFVVAIKDRKIRIEIGTGISHLISDEIAGNIIDSIIPDFRHGQYYDGIARCVQSLMDRLNTPQSDQRSILPNLAIKNRQSADRFLTLSVIIVVLALLAWFAYRILYITRKKHNWEQTNKTERDQHRRQNESESQEEQNRARERHKRQAHEEARRKAEEDKRTADEERRRSSQRARKDEQYYRRVLGLHSDEDTLEAIRKRYRELASQYHPDKVNHLGDKLKEVAESEMKEINEAYNFFQKKYEL